MYNSYKQYIDTKLFFEPNGTHGVGHTDRVLNLAMRLAELNNLTEDKTKLLAIACCYHDIGRTHNDTDDDHGMMSAGKMLRLGLNKIHNLDDEQTRIVYDLIKCHSWDDDTWMDQDNLILYQILKDADALDRLRFNDLDVKYLRLPQSSKLIKYELNLLKEAQISNWILKILEIKYKKYLSLSL